MCHFVCHHAANRGIFVWTPINDTGVLGGDKLRRLGGGDLYPFAFARIVIRRGNLLLNDYALQLTC